MVTIRPKTSVTMKMTAVGDSHSKSVVSVRDVAVTIDEPTERGGTNLGLTPTETMIASLIGCTNVISKKIAHKAGFELGELSFDVSVKFDRRGVTLVEEVETPFSDLVMNIEAKTDATPEQFEAMKVDLAKYCAIAKVMRASGISITENWTTLPL